MTENTVNMDEIVELEDDEICQMVRYDLIGAKLSREIEEEYFIGYGVLQALCMDLGYHWESGQGPDYHYCNVWDNKEELIIEVTEHSFKDVVSELTVLLSIHFLETGIIDEWLGGKFDKEETEETDEEEESMNDEIPN